MANFFSDMIDLLGRLLPGRGRRLGTPSADVPQSVAEEEFLHWGKWHDTPNSTNVSAFHYDAEDRKLTVQYRGVAIYEYAGVSEEEAHSAFIAASAGRWVWDALRVRGTKCGHRKDYVFRRGLSSWAPKHPCRGGALSPAAPVAQPGSVFGQVFGTRKGKKARRRH